MTTTTAGLTEAELLKFRLLASGLAITPAAQTYIDRHNGERPMTPADYASTSGLILSLADDVWVNAPISLYNANFVLDTPYRLDLSEGALVVHGEGLESPAQMWLPPAFHEELNEHGEAYTSYAFTHGDRVRISPIEGCGMTCKFCNLPYEFRYRTKRIEGLVDSVRRALTDPIQPAHHVLISGGTPREADIDYVRDSYEAVITSFPETDVDVMMVPIDHLMDVEWLAELGVSELSVNLEIYNLELAAKLMRRKAQQGREHYLDYLEHAASVLGSSRVRSMLMVGLEPIEDTLAGVDAIARRGATPVLSPFRPDPLTPLRDHEPIGADRLAETYLRARDIAAGHGIALGPRCIPCSHNTLTLAVSAGSGDADHFHGRPHVV